MLAYRELPCSISQATMIIGVIGAMSTPRKLVSRTSGCLRVEVAGELRERIANGAVQPPSSQPISCRGACERHIGKCLIDTVEFADRRGAVAARDRRHCSGKFGGQSEAVRNTAQADDFAAKRQSRCKLRGWQ